MGFVAPNTPSAPPPPPRPPNPPQYANPATTGAAGAAQRSAAAAEGQGFDQTIQSSPQGAATPNTAKQTLGS